MKAFQETNNVEYKRLGVSRPKYEVTASDVLVSFEALITRPDIQLEGPKSGTKSALSQTVDVLERSDFFGTLRTTVHQR